jgi:hypothetical protein
MPLTREQIESTKNAKIIKVEAFGGECCLRLMTVGDRDSYEVLLIENGGQVIPDFRSELVARTLCDEEGELLYPGKEGVEALRKLPADEIHRLWMAAMKHNAMTEEEIRNLAGE